jgi:hypothetical protein
MFFVWDGNHRFTAWWRHINAQHVDDLLWHYSVFCIVFDPKGCITLLLNCMHDVNWWAHFFHLHFFHFYSIPYLV